MQVVILAGGKGSRVRAVAGGRPKSLLEVAGRPFIEHQFKLLLAGGVREVLLCVGFLGEQIEQHVGDGARFGLKVGYAREQPDRLLGTGGALVNALPGLRETFMVLYGDSYLPLDYSAVARAFERRRSRALMCVYRNAGQWDKSNVRVDGGRVVFYSKAALPGEADYIDYGLSVFKREVVQAYRESPLPLDLSRVLRDLVVAGELAAFVAQRRFYEIGKPEGLAELECHLQKKAAGRRPG